MKLVADLHVHTISSGHAYSTISENARAAGDKGLELIAITDHGPAMPGGTHPYHFTNMRVLPRTIFGVEILRGVEANIVDSHGSIDLADQFLKYLDLVLAGFHFDCFKPGSVEDNTRAMINAIASGKVDIIVHPGNPGFKIDPELVATAATKHNVLLEINNTSLAGASRVGSRENCTLLARTVARLGGRVSLGSDAHYSSLVGELGAAAQLAEAAGLGAKQVLNTSRESIKEFLRSRGRRGIVLPTPQV
jgi:putative hydrolase